jgi:hypothetical protein
MDWNEVRCGEIYDCEGFVLVTEEVPLKDRFPANYREM